MKNIISTFIIFMLIFSFGDYSFAQSKPKYKPKYNKNKKVGKKKKPKVYSVGDGVVGGTAIYENNDPIEDEKCWRDFSDEALIFQAQFCGTPEKSFMQGVFRGKPILRTNYGMRTKNAYYLVGFFDWKEVANDEKTLRRLYDDLSKDLVNRSKGTISLIGSKNIQINGMFGDESIFSNSQKILTKTHTLYSDNKIFIILVGHYYETKAENMKLYEDAENKFLNSFKLNNR